MHKLHGLAMPTSGCKQLYTSNRSLDVFLLPNHLPILLSIAKAISTNLPKFYDPQRTFCGGNSVMWWSSNGADALRRRQHTYSRYVIPYYTTLSTDIIQCFCHVLIYLIIILFRHKRFTISSSWYNYIKLWSNRNPTYSIYCAWSPCSVNARKGNVVSLHLSFIYTTAMRVWSCLSLTIIIHGQPTPNHHPSWSQTTNLKTLLGNYACM